MGDSSLSSIFGPWNKLLQVLSCSASSSGPLVVPNLTQLSATVYEVYSPRPSAEPELEIVFFHGLQMEHYGNAYFTTWMSRDNSQLWLQTWLVEEFPRARILTISYDSSAKTTNQGGRLGMYCTGENLVHSLTSGSVRVGRAGCPVVMVGHCLGGLVLKKLCTSAGGMLARQSGEGQRVERIHDLFSNLRGMFFYGTPHAGSLLVDNLGDCFNSPLLEEIEILKASSARTNMEFNQFKKQHQWLTYGIGELQETYVESLGRSIHIVPEASTRPGMDNYYSAAADHHNVCKPESKKSGDFQFFCDFLLQIQESNAPQAGALVVGTTCMKEYFVDLEDRATKVNNMLMQAESRTIFIVGFSGIGKTTLARQVFQDISHKFDVRCFVFLNNEAHSDSNEQVLRKVEERLEGVRTRLHNNHLHGLPYQSGKKVLIVLDNVKSQGQIRVLQESPWLTGIGSRVLVTTTNSRLGNLSNTFEVPYFSERESEQLFLHYAFRDSKPPEFLRNFTKQLLKKCGNSPLFLKVLGSFLDKEGALDKRLWLDLINRLGRVQEVASGEEYRLWARLRSCYETLVPSDTERDIFLDVATVFHGFPLALAEQIWSGCRESEHLAWRNLKRGFLVNVDEDGLIWMHELIRKLGQSIACPQNTSVDKWKRVPQTSDAKELIEKYNKGEVDTQAVKLGVMENERLVLSNTTFDRYVHLEYLMLEGVETTGGSMELPKSLVYLRWKGGLFHTCPVDFSCLANLVVVELLDCRAMKLLPSSIVKAGKLRWLDLNGCRLLIDLPDDFHKLHNLHYLRLNRTRLKKFPSNIGKLKKLENLQASKTLLAQVPQSIGRLKMLTSLNLSETSVMVLPEAIGDLQSLTTLDLSKTKLSSLPTSIGRLRGLKKLFMQSTHVESLPEPLGDLLALEVLKLGFTPLKALPDSITGLCSLEHLDLSGTQIRTLPNSFGDLEQLEELYLFGTPLKKLPETFRDLSRLKQLHMYQSEKLFVPWSTFSDNHFSSLVNLGVPISVSLDVVEGAESYIHPGDGEIQMRIHPLLSLSSRLVAVKNLEIGGNNDLHCVPSTFFHALEQMPSLKTLYLFNFSHVESLPDDLGTLTQLEQLHLKKWEKLRELPESLGHLIRLEWLVLADLPKLRALPESLDAMPSIYLLGVWGCGMLQSMPRSYGHVSSSQEEPVSSPRVPIMSPHHIWTDSWSLVQCLAECGQSLESSYSGALIYLVECEVMERVLRKEMEERMERKAVDMRVTMELLRAAYLEQHVGHGASHGINNFPTSNFFPPRDYIRPFTLVIRCGTYDTWKAQFCDVQGHTGFISVVGEEGSNEDKEDEESKQDGGEDHEERDPTDDDPGPSTRVKSWIYLRTPLFLLPLIIIFSKIILNTLK